MKSGALLVALVLAAPATAAAATGQAVTFQGSVAHTGAVSAPKLKPPLHRAWQHRFPAEVSYPLIADGKVIVTAYDQPFDTYDRTVRLVALSQLTGKLVWQRELGRTFGASAAYDRGRVFVDVDGPLGTPGSLRAFAAASGRPLWTQPIDSGGGPPAADGGAVYVTHNLGASAFRGSDGRRLWTVASDNVDSESPALSRDTVFVAFSCQKLAARRADGAVRWRLDRGCHGGGGRTPALVGRRVFVREDYDRPRGLFLDGASGRPGGATPSDIAPAFAHGIGLFPILKHSRRAFQAGHTLVARSLATGRRRWRFRGDGYLDSAPLVVNRTAYVASGSGRLYALSLRTGRPTWRTRLRFPVPQPFEEGFVLAGLGASGGLLVVPSTRRLVAFR